MRRARVDFVYCALSAVALMGACSLDERRLTPKSGPEQPSLPGDAEPMLADVQQDARGRAADADSSFLDARTVGSSEAALPPPGDWALPDCQRLVINDGWIDGSSNCVDIQGEVWVRPPGDVPHEIDIAYYYLQTEPVCIGGPPVVTEATILGINLSQGIAGAMPRLYNAAQRGVVGFRFTLSLYFLPEGDVMPFVGVEQLDGAYTVYCMPISAPGTYEMRFSDLRANCWESSSGPTPNVESITSLVFYYPAGWSGASIDMCVRDITAIVQCSSDQDCEGGTCRSGLCAAAP